MADAVVLKEPGRGGARRAESLWRRRTCDVVINNYRKASVSAAALHFSVLETQGQGTAVFQRAHVPGATSAGRVILRLPPRYSRVFLCPLFVRVSGVSGYLPSGQTDFIEQKCDFVL